MACRRSFPARGGRRIRCHAAERRHGGEACRIDHSQLRAPENKERSCTITTAGFAYFVHTLTPAPGARFDTNYLDLRDGQTATINVTGLPDAFDPATIEVRTWMPKHQ